MCPKTPKQNEVIREESRRKIEEAAFTLFAKKGFSNTSINAIAQKAGISKGLIYYYFESKQEMLKAIFQHWISNIHEIIDVPEDMPSKEKIEHFISEYFNFMLRQPQFQRLRIVMNLQPDAMAEIREYIMEATSELIQTNADLFRELGYDDPHAEAYYLGAQMEGAMLGYLSLGDDYPIKAIKEKILENYLRE